MDLVDEQDRALFALELRQYVLQALLEITAILGAREQSTQVQGVDGRVLEDFRHLAVDDLLRQALGNSGFTDAGLADVQRIVLTPAAKDLHGPLDFVVTAYERIDLAPGSPAR